MDNLYKITKILEKYTRRDDKVYSIQLDNAMWLDNVNPDSTWGSSGKKNLGIIKKLNTFWLNNNRNLKLLENKYIGANIIDSEFGKKFKTFSSLDIIGDFERLLKEHNGNTFFPNIPVYQLLEKNNYAKNSDGSITLKIKTKNSFEIHLLPSICYRYVSFFDVVTTENIELLFKEFYKGIKYISENSYQKPDYEYFFETTKVVKIIKGYSYGRDHEADERYEYSTNVLVLGQVLTDKERVFLAMSKSTPLSEIKDIRDKVIEDEQYHTREGGLYNILIKKRNDIALELGITAYLVLENKFLLQLSIDMPFNKSLMLNIHGIREKKVEKYGEFFLEEINKYILNNEYNR